MAPRVFSKLMRYAVEPLRKQDVRLVYYLDDICLLGKSTNKPKKITKTVVNHLTSLGFLINWEKNALTPSQLQDFLGFNFNTKSKRIKVLQHKLNKIIQRSRQAMESTIIRSCHWVASLIGEMTTVIPAIGEALLHVRYLQRDQTKSLKLHGNKNWE